MATNLEKRVLALEKQVAHLQRQRDPSSDPSNRQWVEELYGKFAGDPIFAQAMKLGRQYRKSLRSSSSSSNGKAKGKSRR